LEDDTGRFCAGYFAGTAGRHFWQTHHDDLRLRKDLPGMDATGDTEENINLQ